MITKTIRHTTHFIALIFFFITATFFTHIAHALVAGDMDPSFFTGVPAQNDGEIYATAVQSDDKILIGGNFTTVKGIAANFIARLNADGTLDTAFTTGTGAGANDPVFTTALQPDGKILIGGASLHITALQPTASPA